jgi:cation diffusion facilitator family transporter
MRDGKAKSAAGLIRTAAVIAFAGNVVLAAAKLTAGIIGKSSALIGDGVDSASDVLASIITLAAANIISKPADKKHPWGHGKAESVATAALSFLMFFAGAQLVYASASDLIDKEPRGAVSVAAVAVTAASVALKILLAASQFILAKKSGSAILSANGKNMAYDALVSAGVLISLAISFYTPSPLPDIIIAMLIGVWIIKNAVFIFIGANSELMDGIKSTKHYRVITDAVNAVEGASNPHRARMRRVAGLWHIEFDIDVDPELTVREAHCITASVEREIKSRLLNVYDIMIHTEPRGDDGIEAFGLNESEMKED